MRAAKSVYSLFFFVFILSSVQVSAQRLKTFLKEGDAAMAQMNYYSAAQYFAQAMLIDSTSTDIQWRYAQASRLNYDNDIALRWYQKIYKADNMKMYPEAPFYIGMIQMGLGKYKDAKKVFDKFYKKFKNSKDKERKKLALRSKQYVDACDQALLLMQSPVDVFVEHLDTNVNSKVSEYAPYEYDTTLYFSSLRNKSDRDKDFDVSFNKIYISRKKAKADSIAKAKENHAWKRAIELDSLFNKDGVHNANTCFNKDFSQIYISRCTQVNSSTFTCRIYRSVLKDGKWSDLEELPAPVNVSGANTSQPNVAEMDGAPHLFFASNRAGGEGGLDIWFCRINQDGTFGQALNAGKKVNTPEDEITPFYVAKINTLYFSSTWHKGLGNFDIFKSERKNSEFLDPVNAGYPINSSQNDIYFSINSKKNKAYISSNRKGSYFEDKPTCCNDIYAFSIPSLEDPPPPVDTTKLFVDRMKILCPLTLYFHNDEPNPKTREVTTKKTYKKTYEEYTALRPAYYKEYPKGREGNEKEEALIRIEHFMEDSVDAGMADLEKFAALLEEVMKRNEKVKITMKGFCSPLASTDYNINLAKRRVSSLRNYFMEYKNGMFVKYVNNTNPNEGRIEFFEEDVGELPTSTVSDDVKDTQNSVYSPGAARERKIQILAVSTIE